MGPECSASGRPAHFRSTLLAAGVPIDVPLADREHTSRTRTPAELTFVGTATTIVRLGRFTILTDPNFLRRGQRAYLGLWSRRLTDPALMVDDLPPLSGVVLSHLHGDHFDRVARAGRDRSPPVITTVAAADRLRRFGFGTHGLRNWQQHIWWTARRSSRSNPCPRSTPAA